jgi:hypothetical protein
MIQFYVPFSYQSAPYFESHYSLANLPAFDLSICYAYSLKFRRFRLQAKAGPALFISPLKWDTTDFVEFGKTEFAYGYYDKAIKLGYTIGLNLNYNFFRRFNLVFNANYLAPFNNEYSYFYRERLRYANDPDLTYGLRLNNVQIGLQLACRLGKLKHSSKQEGQ